MNALWNAPISDRFSSLCARVFSPAAAILENEKTLGTRLRTYVRLVNHVKTKRKEVDHIPWVWGSVPSALRARGNPAKKIVVKNKATILFTNHFDLGWKENSLIKIDWDPVELSRKTVMISTKPRPPPRGFLGLIFAGYVPLAFQGSYPIIVYFVANCRPHISHQKIKKINSPIF